MAHPLVELYPVIDTWFIRRKASIAALKKAEKEIREVRIAMNTIKLIVWTLSVTIELFYLPNEVIVHPCLVGLLAGALTCLADNTKFILLSDILQRVQAKRRSEVEICQYIYRALVEIRLLSASEALVSDIWIVPSQDGLYSGRKLVFRGLIASFVWEMCVAFSYSDSLYQYFISAYAMWDCYEGMKALYELVIRSDEEFVMEDKITLMKR